MQKNRPNAERYPLEHQAREQAELNRFRWSDGCFSFLLQRTSNHFNRKGVSQRRHQLESIIHQPLPILSDEILLALYQYACKSYQQECHLKYLHTGFQKTHQEKLLLSTVEKIISDEPT